MKSLFSAATGMDAQQTRIAVISNNIANVNTTGFKASRAEFQDLLYETRALAGTEASAGNQRPGSIQIGSGVQVVSTQGLFTQGPQETTGRNLDLAIEGKGFFGVTLPSGETGYTRAGSLSMDSSGKLVTQNGFPLTPAITLNTAGQDRTIGVDGTISSKVNGTTTTEGSLQIYTFPNEAGLEEVGKNIFKETNASGTASANTPGLNGSGTLTSGALEGSNVNIAEELIRMIMAQRAYELNSKVIQSSDQMLSATNSIK